MGKNIELIGMCAIGTITSNGITRYIWGLVKDYGGDEINVDWCVGVSFSSSREAFQHASIHLKLIMDS